MSAFEPDARFKFLGADGRSPYADHPWPLPRGSGPGAWVKAKGPLVACENGIHVVTLPHLLVWANDRLYTVETRGECVDAGNKLVVREARLLHRVETWNDTTARLFACDCAERALRRVTARHGKQDPRSWKATRVARKFARGEATRTDLAAAWAAARDAARAAARDAARAAARDAARAAAWDAAGDAARAAAGAAERDWQCSRLLQYVSGADVEPMRVPDVE